MSDLTGLGCLVHLTVVAVATLNRSTAHASISTRAMPDGNDSKATSAKDRILPLQLTAFPQSAALTHDAEQCVRDLDSELSTAGFLRVAKGHTPDSARHYTVSIICMLHSVLHESLM